ncbi:MAG: hypothetical protein ACE5JQ_11985 [Candidatus Methylomirabilales bacterium]
MSGNRSRRKGYRLEAKIRKLAQAAGLNCRRVPLSGSAPGWGGDLVLAGRSFEVKARAQGFRRLYGWLEGHFGLVVAADRRKPLVVLRLADFLRNWRSRDLTQRGSSKTSAGLSDTGATNAMGYREGNDFADRDQPEVRSRGRVDTPV